MDATLQALRALLKASGYDNAAIHRCVVALTKPSPSAREGPLLLNQKEAAAFLGVSRFTIRRLALAGELPTIRLRGSTWYRRQDIASLAQVPAAEN